MIMILKKKKKNQKKAFDLEADHLRRREQAGHQYLEVSLICCFRLSSVVHSFGSTITQDSFLHQSSTITSKSLSERSLGLSKIRTSPTPVLAQPLHGPRSRISSRLPFHKPSTAPRPQISSTHAPLRLIASDSLT